MMYGQWANVCLQIIYSRNKLVKSVSKQAKKTGKKNKNLWPRHEMSLYLQYLCFRVKFVRITLLPIRRPRYCGRSQNVGSIMAAA